MDRDVSPPPLKRRRLAEKTAPSVDEKSPTISTSPPTTPNITPNPNSVRIFSWNINGLQPFIPTSAAPITSYFKPLSRSKDDLLSVPSTGTGASTSLRGFLLRHNWPEVLFLQELKISPASETRLASALLSSLNTSTGPTDTVTPSTSYTVDFVLPRDKFNAKGFQGKLYGVGTILRTDFAIKYVTHVRAVDWDLEGRVSVVETRRGGEKDDSDHKPLALLNVYAVNGTDAPYKSPQTGVVIGTRHDHKLAFHSRLRDECLALEARGFDVVVAGDLNIARGLLDGHPNLRTWPAQHCRNRADFNAKFFRAEDNKRAQAYLEEVPKGGKVQEERCFDGVDVFRALHGAEKRYTYHGRSKPWGASADRVDLIFVSQRLWKAGRVSRTDICDSPQERGPSDHVPLWVEIQDPL